MCGIAGVWGREDEKRVRWMMDRIAHRGPDAEGIHRQAGTGTLGHVRLSIMDPGPEGNQPIYNEHGTLGIVANGEIYNFPQLRRALHKTHKFATSNDSEAALHLYEELGAAAAPRLDGMFAFALANGEELFLARDAIGIKGLYVAMDDEENPSEWHFGSELKAMTRAHNAGMTVREFPPGTTYSTRNGFMPYYTVPALAPREMPLDLRLKIVRQTLEDAVGKRMMADVPVGAFLSGGLDSSLIAAIARQHVDELHTFSVGLEGAPDLEAARLVSRHLDTIHHEYVIGLDEVRELMPEIIYHLESFDQDLVRSAIPCYFCSRMAAEHVKVILTGEGADEIFAGYTYYKDIEDQDVLHEELRRSIAALHDVNLQRVDRLTMAHGLEGRVPFLDLAMIEMGMTIPPELKLPTTGPNSGVEKWVLRKATEDLLPSEIVWRDKAQFDEGSGTVDALDDLVHEMTEGFDGDAWAASHEQDGIRSKEEAFYHKLLSDATDGNRAIFDNVGRWADRPELIG